MAEQGEFLVLLLKHETDVKAFIASMVRDVHVRDDVFQEVALTLWQRMDEYDRKRSFGAWARGIAANKILQRRHQDARFPVTLSDEAVAAVLAAFDRTEEDAEDQARALEECLQGVPPRTRDLLTLRYGHGLRGQEIAGRLRLSVDAVYQALSRVRSALEECIRRRLRSGQGGAS